MTVNSYVTMFNIGIMYLLIPQPGQKRRLCTFLHDHPQTQRGSFYIGRS